MKLHLPFGKTAMECEIPDRNILEILQPRQATKVGSAEDIMKRAFPVHRDTPP